MGYLMKITFTGTHSTGKTTLLNELKNMDCFKDYTFCDEITRKIQRSGEKINEQGTDSTQLKIMDSHINNLQFNKSIMDRCILDGFVYTKYLATIGQIKNDDVMEYAKYAMLTHINNYDKIFYLVPEFGLVDDGVRSSNTKFQDDVLKIFDSTIKHYNIPVINIRGTVEQRMRTILKELNVTI
jgi:nicotinamide riboside kinase